MSMVVSHGPWRMFAIPKVVGGKLLQGSLINSRLLLISLLSTSDTATTFAIDKSKAANDLKPPTPGCYAVTPLVYSKRCWVHQSCLAGGLPYIRHLIGRPNLNPPSARSFSTHNGEEKGHQLYDINTEDFVKLVKQNQEGLEGLQLIDVREPEELEETGKIPGSINIPCRSVFLQRNRITGFFRELYISQTSSKTCFTECIFMNE